MRKLTLYRKRIIPEECIELKDDKILSADKEHILTSWKTLRPKKELDHGLSYYMLAEGFKISKFYNRDHRLLYWYCDIVKHTYDSSSNTYIFTDLLADVIVYPDNFVKVVDLGEISEALDSEKLSLQDAKRALLITDKLLNLVYSGGFAEIQSNISKMEQSLYQKIII